MPELIEKLMEDGYTEEAKELKEYYRNAIIFCVKEINDIPTGASKVGGFPDLPPEIEYPTMSAYTETWLIGENKGKPRHYEKSAMQLDAQINLYELAESGADVENLLPKTGMLYIFWNFEFEECDYNFIYWDGDMSTLKRTETSEKYTAEVIITFEAHEEYDASSVYYEKLNELVSDYGYDPDALADTGDKLLGYPAGVNCPELNEGEILLFQYRYQEGCVWAEYWTMREEYLKKLDFSKVSMDFDTD